MAIEVFDPVLFSVAENKWLLDNLGKPTVVAMRDARTGVNPIAVRPIMDRIQELQELAKHENLRWVGIEPIKEKIQTYLAQNEKWETDHKRNRRAPRYPSMYSYDAKGRPHKGGPGSDSDRVRTYFLSDGTRVPFELQLIPDYVAEWTAPGFTEQPSSAELVEDAASNRFECRVPVNGGICGHTESYRSDSRASRSAARARMSKHLRRATENTESHRELHTLEFGE